MIRQKFIEKKIFLIRGVNVMLDKDLAELYGVETRVLNQAVKRNLKRFPSDFMFQLTREENKSLRSQIVTLKHGRGHHRKYLPYAFTEQGVAMLSSVLNSERAIQVNIAIMRVFVNIRKLVSTNKGILNRLSRLENRVQSHDKKIKTIFEVIYKQSDAKLLSPKTPFSNKKTVRDIISSYEKYIYWVDKYFSKVGLDLLSESLNTKRVKNIRILMLSEKANEKFLSLYSDFKKEFEGYGVKCELKVITDKKLGANIHDRWIISRKLCYNVPSTDTVARGQYSEVKKTMNFPPFNVWWRKSNKS
ncbi:MAG: ORF6N domain-containing protein [Elusimicrobia bacterium]|nr:ORF6N domain-containing protein [Elusimicrobiota bacterium]